MPRTTLPQEVEVLRFFEDGPIEKVEAVFNIVTEKMRERSRGERGPEVSAWQTATSRRRRKPVGQTDATTDEPPANVSSSAK